MTLHIDIQNRDGLWQKISPESPVPVGVVGLSSHLDAICDALLDKIDVSVDKVSIGIHKVGQDVESLEPILREIAVGANAPAVVHVAVPDSVVESIAAHIDSLGDLVERRASIAIQISIAENAMWRKLLVGVISVQTFIIVLTMIILTLVERI